MLRDDCADKLLFLERENWMHLRLRSYQSALRILKTTNNLVLLKKRMSIWRWETEYEVVRIAREINR